LRVRQELQGDDYVLEIEGETKQARLFGENLRLVRRLRTALGASSVRIEDSVTNDGFRPTSLALLYHLNFGYLVVAPGSTLVVKSRQVSPRTAAAAALGEHGRFGAPTHGFDEQVFFHDVEVDGTGHAAAAVVNPTLAFGAFVRWRKAELPVLAEWKQLGEGEYVVGLEPATHALHDSRQALHDSGQARSLTPGETVTLSLEVGALPDAAAVPGLLAT
jgi:hypothetical protein